MKKLLLSIFLALSMTASHAWEPKKDITIVVGFPAGGIVDSVARVVAERFTLQGYNTIVINQPGAQGAIAANRVASTQPDGHTVLLTSTAFMYSKILKQPAATYDIFKDFTHLQTIAIIENRVYANPNTVSGDMSQVVNDIRNGRKNYTWGSAFAGSEFTVRLIEEQVKRPLTIVPYNGAPAMVPDLAEGRIDLVIESGHGPINQLVSTGKVKFLGTANPKSAGQTTFDQYLPGVITQSWYGISLPANAPDDIVKFYNELVAKSMDNPDTKSKLLKMGFQLPDQHSTLLASVLKRDLIKYQPIADRLNNK